LHGGQPFYRAPDATMWEWAGGAKLSSPTKNWCNAAITGGTVNLAPLPGVLGIFHVLRYNSFVAWACLDNAQLSYRSTDTISGCITNGGGHQKWLSGDDGFRSGGRRWTTILAEAPSKISIELIGGPHHLGLGGQKIVCDLIADDRKLSFIELANNGVKRVGSHGSPPVEPPKPPPSGPPPYVISEEKRVFITSKWLDTEKEDKYTEIARLGMQRYFQSGGDFSERAVWDVYYMMKQRLIKDPLRY